MKIPLLGFFLFFSGKSILAEAFSIGEKLYYRVRWNQFTAGYSKVEIKREIQTPEGPAYEIVIITRSSKNLDSIFKVRDKIVCQYLYEKRLPYYTLKLLNEGFYRRYYRHRFSHKERKVEYALKQFKGNTLEIGKRNPNARWEYKKGVEKNLPPDIQDTCSALYYMRSDPRQPQKGQKFFMKIFDDGRRKDLGIQILDFETLKLPAGTFPAMRVKPLLKGVGFFKHIGDRIFVWVSHDKHRYPLKVEADLPIIGSIIVELIKVEK